MSMPMHFPGDGQERPPEGRIREPVGAPAAAPVPASARAREDNAFEPVPEHAAPDATVYPFPHSQQGENAPNSETAGTEMVIADTRELTFSGRLKRSVIATADDAKDSFQKALEGAIWNTRPPSLRDVYARAKRVDKISRIPLINWIGDALDWVCLFLAAACQMARWLVSRRARVLGLIVLVCTVLAFLAPAAMLLVAKYVAGALIGLALVPIVLGRAIPGAVSTLQDFRARRAEKKSND